MTSRRNIEKVHPGLFDTAVAASAAGKIAAELFRPGKAVSAVDEWIIAVTKIVMRRVAKSAAKGGPSPDDIVGPIKRVFLDIKPVFDAISSILFYPTTLV